MGGGVIDINVVNAQTADAAGEIAVFERESQGMRRGASAQRQVVGDWRHELVMGRTAAQELEQDLRAVGHRQSRTDVPRSTDSS